MKVYKLFRILKDGSISSLFINKRARYNLNEWMEAQNIPTKGYAKRFGWHSTSKPEAPHLSLKNRAWFEVEIDKYEIINRPISQGGIWYISKKLKINKQI